MENYNLTKQHITNFEDFLRNNEKSQNTITKYIRDVTAFYNYSNGLLSKETLMAYKSFLLEKAYAIKSINSMLASINSLLDYLGLSNLHIKALRIQKQTFRPCKKDLSQNEYVRLCAAAKEKRNERLELLLQTICATGIRISELKYITVEAVKNGEAVISLKGKTRNIIIVKKLQKKLLQYAAKRKILTGQIFITRTGRPLNRSNIWREMKSLCVKSGIDPQKVFPHNLRHLFAKTFYNAEKDIAKLADILGHSSIDTTRIYIISTGDEHRKRMEKLHLII